MIIWTRVTPSPAATPGSGMGAPVDLRWEVGRDRQFASLVASGSALASAASDHTVKVDVVGLSPGTDYWYRFTALGATSPVGRTRTAPAAGAPLTCIRLGVVTCSEYEFGFFAAYGHLAKRDDIDAVVHLGDYIYEFGLGYGSPPTSLPTPGASIGRAHNPPRECVSLADYRVRYGQYRLDAGAQAMHAAHPVIVMWDDHEVANDTWREGAQNHQPDEGAFPARAAAGRQAWREWLPVRQVAADPEVAHRSFRFGDLVELWMLDERRYRDQQPTNVFFSYGSADPAVDDPARTMLGQQQRGWLLAGLASSAAAWKVLGNPVVFFPLVIGPPLVATVKTALGPVPMVPLPPPLGVEDWNGYTAERRTIIELLATKPVKDVVVLTGDYHESFVTEIPRMIETYALDGNSVGVEFVVPSVTSPGLAETLELGGLPESDPVNTVYEANLAVNNPWVRYHEGRLNGFGVVEFAAGRAHFDFWHLANRLEPSSTATVGASWEVLRGSGKATVASGPLPAKVRSSGNAASASRQTPPSPVLPATGASPPLLAPAAAGAAAAALAARRVRRAMNDES